MQVSLSASPQISPSKAKLKATKTAPLAEQPPPPASLPPAQPVVEPPNELAGICGHSLCKTYCWYRN